MQNKLFSLTLMLLTSVATTVIAAEVKPVIPQQAVETQVKDAPKPVEVKPVKDLSTDVKASEKADVEASLKSANPDKATFPALKPQRERSATRSKKTPDEIRAENKRRMEEELRNTTTAGKSIVDSPNRSSLGTMELAPLPAINESIITGPAPMAQSVSSKDLPSEQLLGRITPEVFQEMADLERGNTFLKLQIEKEKMKNDLEKLKASYREKRLSEIAKREDVVRSRIQWWQEQEKIRLAIEKKEKEAEKLDRQIAEQEANRERIREEALKRMNAPKVVAEAPRKDDKKPKTKPVQDQPKEIFQSIEELYTIESIKGVGSKLAARLKANKDKSIVTVKKDDILPSGHVVREVKKDAVVVMFGNRMDQLTFRPVEK